MTETIGVGSRVYIDAVDGFGGPATVIETRESPYSRFKVSMDDGNPPPFWAHDFEVSTLDDGRPEDSSIVETRKHINEVRRRLALVIDDLHRRAREHDASKLVSPEAETFAEWTSKLRGMTYGSDEYRAALAAMKPALDHHYRENSHHPEHFAFEFGEVNPELVANGSAIKDMSLIDIIEMLCDWDAATKRHADGNIRKSIELNQRRFGYSDELKAILLNTLPLIEGGPSRG